MAGDEATWPQQWFGACDLGDSRRTRRLVDVGARLARQRGLVSLLMRGQIGGIAGQ